MNEKVKRPLPARPHHADETQNKWRRLFKYRKDMFSALPPKLYRAWMAQVKTPFYSSFMINDPEITQRILKSPARDFPKSETIYDSIKSMLGETSVFVTNGDLWEMQRRIINPAFEGGRVKAIYPAMQDAAEKLISRLNAIADGEPHDIEFECSHFAADIIFRTLFSVPIEHELARDVFENFQSYQREQPVFNFTNLMRMPKWVPRFQSARTKASAKAIRSAIGALVDRRLAEIDAGTAPDDLATKIMTTIDPVTGHQFSREEMIDQVAIFFLAGHETSASALGWALYLLALHPEIQSKAREEALEADLEFARLNKLKLTRNIFHETLRLYAPVPMLVRETTKPTEFRERAVKAGDLCILSVWHSGRHERIWDAPHEFHPERWDDLPPHCRDAFFPFSGGERICIGAGFALIEALLGIASVLRNFELRLGDEEPVPVAYLTTRAQNGISLRIFKRSEDI